MGGGWSRLTGGESRLSFHRHPPSMGVEDEFAKIGEERKDWQEERHFPCLGSRLPPDTRRALTGVADCIYRIDLGDLRLHLRTFSILRTSTDPPWPRLFISLLTLVLLPDFRPFVVLIRADAARRAKKRRHGLRPRGRCGRIRFRRGDQQHPDPKGTIYGIIAFFLVPAGPVPDLPIAGRRSSSSVATPPHLDPRRRGATEESGLFPKGESEFPAVEKRGGSRVRGRARARGRDVEEHDASARR